MAMDMELCITGPEPGKIDHTLYCHVMNLEEPLHLQVQAEFKGPEMSIDEPDINFGLMRLGQTVSKEITVNNMSQIITTWSIQDSPEFASSENDMAFSEFTFEPFGRELKPLESKKVKVTFQPVSAKSVRLVIEVMVEEGTDCNISCFAEVLVAQVCLEGCELAIPEIYKKVPVLATAKLINQTLLPTVFEWGDPVGDDTEDCRIELEPRSGMLEPREEKLITVHFIANRMGDFSDFRIPCKIEGMDSPLILSVFCDVKGLSVTYSVSQDAENTIKNENIELNFGDKVELGSVPKLYLHVQNKTAITARYRMGMENFFSKPPTPPDVSRDEVGRPSSTRRMLLGRTPNLADPFSKTVVKANADLSSALLSQGKGASFVPSPSAGVLSPFSEEIIEISAYSDIWGVYSDNLICQIGELEETKILVSMTVVGCPLSFQMTAAQPDLKPVVRFGSHVAGTSTYKRTMRVNNTSPYDIRVDWETHNVIEGDNKLIDLMSSYGKPFPLKDSDDNEIVPPTEQEYIKRYGKVPEPYVREPTDFIPDFGDTSAATSREVTQANISQNNVTAEETKAQQRPKVVSLVCRAHEGQSSAALYSIKPTQLAIPAKGHANVVLSFTPYPTAEVPKDMDCIGYMLGYMSLDNERAIRQKGLVTRSQAYDTAQVRLDMTAHLKPALLTLECADEDGMRYRSVMSSLLQQYGGLKAESLSVNSVMLSNLTLTPLTFRLVTQKPFMLVELDPSSNKEGNTRAQSTDMHTLKPRHNLVVKVAFQTTSHLLSEIASDYLNNEDDLSGAGRKIELKDNLVVEFNNKASQLKAESLSVNSVMLSNLTLTPLTFRLVTQKPFMLVELDPSSNKEGNTRAQSTDMHTLKPRHNLVVKVAFQTTSHLLSEIASDYLNNEDDLSGAGRKIELKDNLVVEFNNKASQLVPLHATLTVPQFTLSKESLDFGVCLVGQTRELQLKLSNLTSSHTQWSISQESKSDTCATNTFRVEPTQGLLEAHITHISDSKILLRVYFTAKHAEDYETVFTVHGVLGETPRRLNIRGQGSYDGKHEAILNI